MNTDPRNIFVLGLDDHHLAQLRSLARAREYRFHELFRREDVKSGREDVAERVLAGARQILAGYPGRVDAVVGYWDFPVSTMLPLVRSAANLSGPSFESVLKCEHKYWSRVEQARIVPDHVPRFCSIDPFAHDVTRQITLDFPFWLKPVKSVLSFLGFRVHDAAELEHAIARIREGIHTIAVPFNYLLRSARLPAEIASVDGTHCIAEAIISEGRQCTLEGYTHGTEVVVYGAVDSVREGRHGSCFSRYQYPSTLPAAVLERMNQIARRFLNHVDYRDSPFNAEFYFDERTGHISLLEVNTRISKSHCALFKKVDGEYHHQVMLDVALGERPAFPHRQGEHSIAAKFMWRTHEDAWVRRAPSAQELEALQAELPGVEVELHVRQGTRLSQLAYQDSYSYEIAAIFIGGESETELEETYRQCQTLMNVQLEPA